MNDRFIHFGELFRYLEQQPPKEDFLHYRKENRYETVSKETFLHTVRALTLSFYKRGWQGRQIGVAVPPSPFWLMIDYAVIFSGAVSVPLFTNISSKNLRFQIDDADIGTVFIGDEVQKHLIEEISETIDTVSLSEQMEADMHLAALIDEGEQIAKEDPVLFERLLDSLHAEDVVTIVYTSGTSGTPKGVELTHTNLISQIHATAKNYHFDREEDVAFSLLPLAHIFERMVMNFYLSQELSVYFADDVKNVGILLKEVNPTVMTVVPRLLEKVYFKMEQKALDGNIFKQLLVRAAFYRARKRDPSHPPLLLDRLFESLVYAKLRQALGTRMRMMISGGAPLSDDIYRFYLNIGIGLYQGYGLTESSPVIAANTPEHNKVGTCGRAFPGVEIRIEEDELLARGPNIMRGYHNRPEETAKVIDKEGWLHTGDRAGMDEEGYVRIFGRKSDLFKTSTGEFVSSIYIEQALTENGWFEHALVIGDGRPYVTALLFIEPAFLENLAIKMRRSEEDAVASERFVQMVKRFIKKINKRLNHWERIRDYRVITDTLSIEEGHLTPSMKLAKRRLMQLYCEEIEQMYKDHP